MKLSFCTACIPCEGGRDINLKYVSLQGYWPFLGWRQSIANCTITLLCWSSLLTVHLFKKFQKSDLCHLCHPIPLSLPTSPSRPLHLSSHLSPSSLLSRSCGYRTVFPTCPESGHCWPVVNYDTRWDAMRCDSEQTTLRNSRRSLKKKTGLIEWNAA